MQGGKFYQLGRLINQYRWWTIGVWLMGILFCLPFIHQVMKPFKTTGFIAENSPSAKAAKEFNQQLGYSNTNQIIIMYTSKKLIATSSLFQNKIKNSLSRLTEFPVKHEIIYPGKKQISVDKHTAYVVVIVQRINPLDVALLNKFTALLQQPKNMIMQLGGEPFFVKDVNKQTQLDLLKADLVAAPVAILTLLLIFGSVVAAILPIVLGASCALITLILLYSLGHLFTLSIFTINIALLLGLCLSLDYSLFIISRFREELDRGLTTTEAIAVTQATAGRAIFFSGLAVFISLSALLLFPINILFSVGVGGLTAVFVAVFLALFVLPAMLSVLQFRINYLPVKLPIRSGEGRFYFWKNLAQNVIKRPLLYFISIFIVLLLLGYPFINAKFGVSDSRILPEHVQSRSFFDTYTQKFDKNNLSPILLLVYSNPNKIFSHQTISRLYELANKLKENPSIKEVNSIVTTTPRLTKEQYYKLYNAHKSLIESSVKKLIATTTRYYFTAMNIISQYKEDSPKTKSLISELHNLKVKHLELQVTGTAVNNIEVLESITRTLPYAVLWIIGFSYLILLILLRSLFLPFKAILMNILSLCACYGALVFVFQEGHLHELLNFHPQGMLDISLLVIIFCALFGFSMDYEVFLLTRIRECYEEFKDNDKSIIFGIVQSSKIITSAALIVIVISGSFMVAHVLMIKAFGLGIAVAIFVDAFLIRAILVPSTMALIKQWNWYLPKWLDKIVPKL